MGEARKMSVSLDDKKFSKRQKITDSLQSSDNPFPWFASGTVEIHLSDKKEDHFRLSRATLTRTSTWFSEQTKCSDGAAGGHTGKYLFKLVQDPGSPIPMLKLVISEPLSPSDPKVPKEPKDDDATPGLKDAENTSEPQVNKYIEVYRHFLGILYNDTKSKAQSVSQSDINIAFKQCSDIMHLSKIYGAEDSFRSLFISKLGEFRDELWMAIAKDPPKWVNLSVSLRSGPIFAEGVIHCVGGFPDYKWESSIESLVPIAKDVVGKKASQLVFWKKNVDMALFQNSLADEDGDRISFVTSIESWFAVSFFREWLSNELHGDGENTEQDTHQWPSKAMYEKMAKGGSGYLKPREVAKLFESNIESYERYSWEHLADDLETLKDYAAKEVTPLLKSKLKVDVEEAEIPYLTCMDVKKHEYPWRLMVSNEASSW